MTIFSRIGLGTVQFGLPYGVSNGEGQPTEREVAAILARACECGIGYLDTAAEYGEAEALIGRHLPRCHDIRVVTKLPRWNDRDLDDQLVQSVPNAIDRSRARLNVDRLYGVLLHHAGDLSNPSAHRILDALYAAQDQGWIERIGVSVYDAAELALIEPFRPQIVQLPFNALDRRLAESGWLRRLEAAGVELHARSVFLQGLLLMPVDRLPAYFSPISTELCALHSGWAAQGKTSLAGCLASVLSYPQIALAVVGVNKVIELEGIIAALGGLEQTPLHAPAALHVDTRFVDPRRWPKFA